MGFPGKKAKEPGLGRLFKSSTIYLLGNVLNRVGAFLLIPVFTRALPLYEYGVLEIIYSATAVAATLLGIGLSHTTIRFYFEYDSVEERNAVVTTNIFLVTAICSLAACITIIGREPIAEMLLDDAGRQKLIVLAIGIVGFELIIEVGLAYFRAVEIVWGYVTLSGGKLFLYIVLSIYFVLARKLGVLGVLLANVVTNGSVCLAVLAVVYKRCGARVKKEYIFPLLRYAWPFALSGIIGVFMANFGKFVLKETLSMKDVGLFGLAIKLNMIVLIGVLEPFTRAYGPYRFSQMRVPGIDETHGYVTYLIFVACAIFGAFVSLFIPDLLLLITPLDYWQASGIVPVLVLGTMLRALHYCFETGILYEKQTKVILGVSVATLLWNILLNLALVPALGVMGAAWAESMTAAGRAFLMLRMERRYFHARYRYWKMWLVAAGFGAILLLMHYMAGPFGEGSIAVKLTLFGVALGMFSFDSDIRKAANAVTAAVRPRVPAGEG